MQIEEEGRCVRPQPAGARIKVLAPWWNDVASNVATGPSWPTALRDRATPCWATWTRWAKASPSVQPGDRVAALTQVGGRAADDRVAGRGAGHVPPELDPAPGCGAHPPDYLVAYQILHRVVQVQPGEKGAHHRRRSGGVGTAGPGTVGQALTMYRLASAPKHPILEEHGATPIGLDAGYGAGAAAGRYPGIDYVFNGMGEEYFERGLAVLARRCAGPLRRAAGFARFSAAGQAALYNVLPNGKRIKSYGTHRDDVTQYKRTGPPSSTCWPPATSTPSRTFPLLDAVKRTGCWKAARSQATSVLLAGGDGMMMVEGAHVR
ncbi:MAG: hypothetical protein R3A10_10660 [Caldilineaceae bacterium]